jgi:hypothetical protein
MPLIHRAICREEVIVLATFGIPEIDSFSFGKDYRKWVIIMCSILIL